MIQESATNLSDEPIFDPQDEDDVLAPVDFAKKPAPPDHMDMTPMVDVTFLLLIFFMVTASFTSEKAIQQQASVDKPSSQSQPKEDNESVRILIDEFNAYTVIFPDGGESEATSKQELISILKLAELDGSSEEASNMLIEAHEESIHAAVVGALDAGRGQGFNTFKVTVVESFD